MLFSEWFRKINFERANQAYASRTSELGAATMPVWPSNLDESIYRRELALMEKAKIP